MRTADLRTAGRGRGVSGRAVFGDFTGAARQQLGSPAALRTAAVRGGHVPEIRHSLLRLLLVMSRYVQDITLQPVRPPSLGPPPPAGWDRAGLEAREALRRALAGLYGDTISRRRPGVQAGSELARRLDGAALSLTYGRDLLHTHLARGPRGGVRYRSEWGNAVTSPRVHQALLAELGFLARQLAPLGEDLARSPRARGSPAARQAVTGACHWLQTMDTSIRRALREDPLPASVCGAAARCPGQFTPAPATGRRHPGGRQPARGGHRCRGAGPSRCLALGCAAAVATRDDRELPAAGRRREHVHQPSLRIAAPLPRYPSFGYHGGSRDHRTAAAEAAGQARVRWLGIAHALDQVTTSSQEQSPQPRPQPATSRCRQAASPTPTRAGVRAASPPTAGTDGEPGSRARRSRPPPGRGA